MSRPNIGYPTHAREEAEQPVPLCRMRDVFDAAQRAICDAMIQRGAILTDSACESVLTILRERFGEAVKDAAYFKWKLGRVVPLLQEARDALPAISKVSAQLRGVSLTLADRMDAAGTATRADYDAAMQPTTL